MIPQTNVSDLMLRKGVVEAVAAGKFHIYPVSTIEQGIEILTRMAAGAEGEDGSYPEANVYGKVERRLAQMARDLRAAARPEKEVEKDAETEKEGADDKENDDDSGAPEN